MLLIGSLPQLIIIVLSNSFHEYRTPTLPKQQAEGFTPVIMYYGNLRCHLNVTHSSILRLQEPLLFNNLHRSAAHSESRH